MITNSAKVIDRLREKLKSDNRVNYLKKDGVIEWILGDANWVKKLTKSNEDVWGKNVIQSNTSQWTTKLGEGVLYELLILNNKNPRKITVGKVAANNKKLQPDFEADDGIYENKARKYMTSGTAGEKILGTPIKYSECRRLFKKPTYIVCMGYQEREAEDAFQLFQPKSEELRSILEFLEEKFDIKYIKASELLKQIL
jgi:hypothetical protein